MAGGTRRGGIVVGKAMSLLGWGLALGGAWYLGALCGAVAQQRRDRQTVEAYRAESERLSSQPPNEDDPYCGVMPVHRGGFA